MVDNERVELHTNTNFLVSVDNEMCSFARVSNLVSQTDDYRSTGKRGGNRKQNNKYNEAAILKLERGYACKRGDCFYWEPGNHINELIIMVLDKEQNIVKSLAVEDAVIVSRKFSDLEGMGNKIFMETLELFHKGLRVI